MHCNASFPYTQDMPTLHQVTEETKTTAVWGSISVVILIVLVMIFNALRPILFPVREPAPTVSFAKLPPIIFPGNTSGVNLSYTIDTLSGDLPVLADQMLVYQELPTQTPHLYMLQQESNKINAIGFSGPNITEIQFSETLYSWTQSGDPPKTIVLDFLSNNFNLTSPYASSQAVLTSKFSGNESTALNIASNFLNAMGANLSDLDSSKTTVQRLMFGNGTLVPASLPAPTQFMRVDFFQNDILKFPGDTQKVHIYYPNPPHSTMNFLITSESSGSGPASNVVNANFLHQNIDFTNSGTYPIKTASEAATELENGGGYIASNFSRTNKISIKDVELGYFAGDTTQQYLMPIIVFSNPETGFYAYVSAVRDEWIQK